MFDLIRLATSFAQDMAALARQITMIAQETRASLTPFRLDTGYSDDALLYAPGTGYGEPAAYGVFGRDPASTWENASQGYTPASGSPSRL
jgi:hypothetical protein